MLERKQQCPVSSLLLESCSVPVQMQAGCCGEERFTVYFRIFNTKPVVSFLNQPV